MARRDSTADGKPGHVYIGRHLDDVGNKATGHYIIASAVKQTVQQRIKFENARYPKTELVTSFKTSDVGVAEREARNRLCAISMGMVPGYPDKRKPPSHSEWLHNQDERKESEIVDCVRETCEEFS